MSSALAFVEAWISTVESLTYDAVRRTPAPHASIGFGAAGTAFTLYRAALELGRPSLLDRADALLAGALRDRRAATAYVAPDMTSAPELAGSVVFGPPGLLALAVLVAHARGEQPAMRRRIRAYLAGARRAPRRTGDFALGLAGQLATTTLLLEATGDTALVALGDEQARRLVASRRTWRAWRPSFAHGRAGVLYALLRHRAATGSAVSAACVAELDRLVTELPPWPRRNRRGADEGGSPQSWCNGAAGLALLGAFAFEQLGDVRYRTMAVRAAKSVLAYGVSDRLGLCCGLAGRAYAALALDRVDPGGGWRARAEELAIAAIGREPPPAPFGILHGYAGVVCLTMDLLVDGRPRGFPMVES